MISINKARELLETHEPVELKFWTKSGEIVHAKEVVCTSSNFKRNTFKIKFMQSEEWRTVRAVSIFEINNKEVCL